MRILKLGLGLVITGALLAACAPNVSDPVASSMKTEMAAPVLTIITQANPETQLMALILSKAASDQGNTVRILLCDTGGDLALKSPPDVLQKPLAPKNISPAGLLTKLIEAGVQVDVCAIYLPNRDFGKEALRDNVGVATPADIAKFYTQADTKVLSF